MFQVFYDSVNDRFIAVPLRGGSSFTSVFADELGWQNGKDIYTEILAEDNSIEDDLKLKMSNCQPLQMFYIMNSEKYRDSKWVSVIRDPMSRYLSAVCMILTSYFDAPQYVPPHEVELAKAHRPGGYLHLENSAYYHVDRLIERRNSKSWFFDFSFSDNHCVPCTSVQLLMCAVNESVELVDLQNWDAWLRKHYPAGTAVPLNFYDSHRKTNRRDNSNTPRQSYISVFDRFLKPLVWFNDFEAAAIGIKGTFSKFIGYEQDAWDALNSPRTDKNINFYQGEMKNLLDDPYFIVRDPLFYNLYTMASKVFPEHSTFYRVLDSIPNRKEELQQFVIENSWLNNIKS